MVGVAGTGVASNGVGKTGIAIASAAGALAPWIRDADAVQQPGFGHLHAPGLAGAVVVVAVQMQGAVDDQVRQVVRGAAPGLVRLAPDHTQGKNNVTAIECQDVGGGVASAVPGIESLDHAVGRQDHRTDDAGFPGRGPGSTCGDGLGTGHQAPPPCVQHDDGWPRRGGAMRTNGRPTSQWSCLAVGRSHDLGIAGR